MLYSLIINFKLNFYKRYCKNFLIYNNKIKKQKHNIMLINNKYKIMDFLNK